MLLHCTLTNLLVSGQSAQALLSDGRNSNSEINRVEVLPMNTSRPIQENGDLAILKQLLPLDVLSHLNSV